VSLRPTLRLAEVRRLQADAKATVRNGGDPLAERITRRAKAGLGAVETVEALARAWHGRQAPRWSPRYAATIISGWSACARLAGSTSTM
jgi:hypothetical protein